MISDLISLRMSSVEMSSVCCVDTTIVSTRTGTTAPPSFLYSIVTCVFVSGRSQGKWPLRRAEAMAWFSLCEYTTVRGMSSGDSSEA